MRSIKIYLKFIPYINYKRVEYYEALYKQGKFINIIYRDLYIAYGYSDTSHVHVSTKKNYKKIKARLDKIIMLNPKNDPRNIYTIYYYSQVSMPNKIACSLENHGLDI